MGCGCSCECCSPECVIATVPPGMNVMPMAFFRARKAVNDPSNPKWHGPVDFALCASGGGSRALSFTMGIYRALWNLQLFEKFNVVSSVSGGTWCSSIFMFAKTYKGEAISTAALVGPATTPSELSMAVLQQAAPPLASGITQGDSDVVIAAAGVEFVGREYEVWPHVMSRWLLRDFDELKLMGVHLALDDAQVTRIKENNKKLDNAQFITMRPDRPKMFVMNGTCLAPVGKLATSENAVSFQMSPDFVGSPFYPLNQQVVYQEASDFPCCDCLTNFWKDCKCCDKKRTVGGGFVESFAFGGKAPKQQEGGEDIDVPEPGELDVFSLPYAVAISYLDAEPLFWPT